VSSAGAREPRSSPSRQTPAPPGALVAVLERNGRFLTAEPAFPPRTSEPSTRRGGSARIVIRSARPEHGPRRDARLGELVLVLPAGGAGGGGAGGGGGGGGGRGRGGGGGGGRGRGARIERVIGSPEIARDAIEALMLDRGLPRAFEAAVEREARGAAERAGRAAHARRDLRRLATFTIDPVGARDFDDAISAEQIGEGSTRVWVHIADVAAHVPEGSLVDREARRRTTSVYVPGAVEPMLPHSLSSDACSLVPGADRAAVTVELELRGATVERAAFYRSLIRSDVRLDYERVDRIFAGTQRAEDPWGGPLVAARAVAAALQERRERAGALVVDSEEPEFSFDADGHISAIAGRVQTESHRLIEHLMIAANEAVAELLRQREVPCLFRVHERPDVERIERLVEQLASLEVPTPPLPEPMSAQQAAELLGAISRRVEEHVRRGGRGRLALSSLVLRSLKQVYYSPRNLGHAGLHSSAYCHFTSPIRRYPDLVCHRALLSAVGGGEQAPRAGELVELGVWSSEREREAMKIERDGDDMARCFALERFLFEHGPDHLFAGEIRGLIAAGAFIAFAPTARAAASAPAGSSPAGERAPPAGGETSSEREPPYEGMLPVRLLRTPARASSGGAGRRRPQSGGRGAERSGEREWWELNEQGTILRGERTGASLRLGDAVEVRVARVERMRGRVDLVPNEDLAAG
jgi:ribonuclease R